MKHLLATLLLLVTIPVSANDFYVGAGGALMNYDSNIAIIEPDNKKRSDFGATGNIPIGAVFAGWNANPYFGLELMTMYGQDTISASDYKLSITTLAPKLMLPFNKWHFFMSLSPSYVHLSEKVGQDSSNDYDGLGIMFQTGANFDITDHLGMGVRYIYGTNDIQEHAKTLSDYELKTSSLMASIQYNF